MTPETSTLGLSAKAWYRDESGELWLYKIGKKELAASRILDTAGANHVPYYDATDEMHLRADEEHVEKIMEAGEKLVKSRIITSEERSIATWYDYEKYCEHNCEINPYDFIRENPRFHEMQVMDYILANSDRHGENWGFFMDADSGHFLDLHPLFDHDNAFSEDRYIPSQTDEDEVSLRKAAEKSLKYVPYLDLKSILSIQQPEELTGIQWDGVLKRTKDLLEN